MRYLFLALLAAATVWHLADSWRDDAKRRRRTKPFLLLFLILYYIFSADAPSLLLLAALGTSWLGDVLLMPNGNKWFVLGGVSFMFTHFLFIGVYVGQVDFRHVLWAAVIPAALLYYGISAWIIRSLTPSTPKMMLVPMYVYLLCNSTMNVFALMQLLSARSLAAAVAYAGAVLFFISDCTLFLVRYHKNKDLVLGKHFTVMLTYVLGEWLITEGMLMLAR